MEASLCEDLDGNLLSKYPELLKLDVNANIASSARENDSGHMYSSSDSAGSSSDSLQCSESMFTSASETDFQQGSYHHANGGTQGLSPNEDAKASLNPVLDFRTALQERKRRHVSLSAELDVLPVISPQNHACSQENQNQPSREIQARKIAYRRQSLDSYRVLDEHSVFTPIRTPKEETSSIPRFSSSVKFGKITSAQGFMYETSPGLSSGFPTIPVSHGECLNSELNMQSFKPCLSTSTGLVMQISRKNHGLSDYSNKSKNDRPCIRTTCTLPSKDTTNTLSCNSSPMVYQRAVEVSNCSLPNISVLSQMLHNPPLQSTVVIPQNPNLRVAPSSQNHEFNVMRSISPCTNLPEMTKSVNTSSHQGSCQSSAKADTAASRDALRRYLLEKDAGLLVKWKMPEEKLNSENDEPSGITSVPGARKMQNSGLGRTQAVSEEEYRTGKFLTESNAIAGQGRVPATNVSKYSPGELLTESIAIAGQEQIPAVDVNKYSPGKPLKVSNAIAGQGQIPTVYVNKYSPGKPPKVSNAIAGQGQIPAVDVNKCSPGKPLTVLNAIAGQGQIPAVDVNKYKEGKLLEESYARSDQGQIPALGVDGCRIGKLVTESNASAGPGQIPAISEDGFKTRQLQIEGNVSDILSSKQVSGRGRTQSESYPGLWKTESKFAAKAVRPDQGPPPASPFKPLYGNTVDENGNLPGYHYTGLFACNQNGTCSGVGNAAMNPGLPALKSCQPEPPMLTPELLVRAENPGMKIEPPVLSPVHPIMPQDTQMKPIQCLKRPSEEKQDSTLKARLKNAGVVWSPVLPRYDQNKESSGITDFSVTKILNPELKFISDRGIDHILAIQLEQSSHQCAKDFSHAGKASLTDCDEQRASNKVQKSGKTADFNLRLKIAKTPSGWESSVCGATADIPSNTAAMTTKQNISIAGNNTADTTNGADISLETTLQNATAEFPLTINKISCVDNTDNDLNKTVPTSCSTSVNCTVKKSQCGEIADDLENESLRSIMSSKGAVCFSDSIVKEDMTKDVYFGGAAASRDKQGGKLLKKAKGDTGPGGQHDISSNIKSSTDSKENLNVSDHAESKPDRLSPAKLNSASIEPTDLLSSRKEKSLVKVDYVEVLPVSKQQRDVVLEETTKAARSVPNENGMILLYSPISEPDDAVFDHNVSGVKDSVKEEDKSSGLACGQSNAKLEESTSHLTLPSLPNENLSTDPELSNLFLSKGSASQGTGAQKRVVRRLDLEDGSPKGHATSLVNLEDFVSHFPGTENIKTEMTNIAISNKYTPLTAHRQLALDHSARQGHRAECLGTLGQFQYPNPSWQKTQKLKSAGDQPSAANMIPAEQPLHSSIPPVRHETSPAYAEHIASSSIVLSDDSESPLDLTPATGSWPNALDLSNRFLNYPAMFHQFRTGPIRPVPLRYPNYQENLDIYWGPNIRDMYSSYQTFWPWWGIHPSMSNYGQTEPLDLSLPKYPKRLIEMNSGRSYYGMSMENPEAIKSSAPMVNRRRRLMVDSKKESTDFTNGGENELNYPLSGTPMSLKHLKKQKLSEEDFTSTEELLNESHTQSFSESPSPTIWRHPKKRRYMDFESEGTKTIQTLSSTCESVGNDNIGCGNILLGDDRSKQKITASQHMKIGEPSDNQPSSMSGKTQVALPEKDDILSMHNYDHVEKMGCVSYGSKSGGENNVPCNCGICRLKLLHEKKKNPETEICKAENGESMSPDYQEKMLPKGTVRTFEPESDLTSCKGEPDDSESYFNVQRMETEVSQASGSHNWNNWSALKSFGDVSDVPASTCQEPSGNFNENHCDVTSEINSSHLPATLTNHDMNAYKRPAWCQEVVEVKGDLFDDVNSSPKEPVDKVDILLPCLLCGTCFYKTRGFFLMALHMMKIHDSDIAPEGLAGLCDVCGCQFPGEGFLENHIVVAHSGLTHLLQSVRRKKKKKKVRSLESKKCRKGDGKEILKTEVMNLASDSLGCMNEIEEHGIKSEPEESLTQQVPDRIPGDKRGSLDMDQSTEEEKRNHFSSTECTLEANDVDSVRQTGEKDKLGAAVSPVENNDIEKITVSSKEWKKPYSRRIGPYLCEWDGCCQILKTLATLKVHMRRHTGEKPFACPNCEYRGRQIASLKWHITHCPGLGATEAQTTETDGKCEQKVRPKKKRMRTKSLESGLIHT